MRLSGSLIELILVTVEIPEIRFQSPFNWTDTEESDEPEIVDAEFTEVDEDDDDKKSGTAWSDYL